MKSLALLLVACFLGCGSKQPSGELHIAAAANLQRVLESLDKAFTSKSGINLVPSYGSSVTLAQQIENGGPFDVFLSADTAQIDKLSAKGLIDKDSRAVYARGVLALWAPRRSDIKKIEDLARPDVKRIGIANPDLAPYGKASIETLSSLHLWPELEPKVVYGPNISVVEQFSESANADASFTALSLVNDRLEKPVIVPQNLHQPIDQALGILKATRHQAEAEKFREFLLGPEARASFKKFGYDSPK